MNSRITSQKRTLATVLLIGSIPASFDSLSSRVVDERILFTTERIRVASSHATSARIVPATSDGR